MKGARRKPERRGSWALRHGASGSPGSPMADRAAAVAAFLAASGWGQAMRRKLAGDASFRRYDRLEAEERRVVLMDAPPPQEDVRPYLAVARLLRSLGLSAPEILAEDTALGLLL